jgi:hypothetical protein
MNYENRRRGGATTKTKMGNLNREIREINEKEAEFLFEYFAVKKSFGSWPFVIHNSYFIISLRFCVLCVLCGKMFSSDLIIHTLYFIISAECRLAKIATRSQTSSTVKSSMQCGRGYRQ